MDFYESLVKEYLESKGYFVRTNIKVLRKEIDILAIDPISDTLIFGEVKSCNPTKKVICEINDNIFKNNDLRHYIENKYPNKKIRLCLFCWVFQYEDKKLIRESNFDLSIEIISYGQILKEFHDSLSQTAGMKYTYDSTKLTLMMFQLLFEYTDNFYKARFK